MTQKSKARTKRNLETVIKRAEKFSDPGDIKEALEEVAEPIREQSPPERIPGGVIRGNKIPWTESDAMKVSDGKAIEFTPLETMPFTWNGLRFQLLKGVSMAIPEIVYKAYVRNQRQRMSSQSPFGKDSGYEVILNLGAGPLEPEK